MRRWTFILAAALTGCIAGENATDPGSAEGEAEALSDGNYTIFVRHTGFALSTDGSSAERYARAVQTPLRAGDGGQQWSLRHKADGSFEIVSVKSGMCLDVGGHSVADGAIIQQFPCSGLPNQSFRVESVGDGYSHLVGSQSSKCLDVTDVSMVPGAKLQQWTCSPNNGNQKWRLVSLGAAPSVTASVTVDHAATGYDVDPSFIGLSFEKNNLQTPAFNANNKELISLFKSLGAGIFRVGANLVDRTTWSPNGKGGTAGTTAPADIERLAGFLRATDWKVIYAVNMAKSTPAIAADEARAAAKALGDRLYGFEIGNEPNLYPPGNRPAGWGYAQFKTEWESYANAMRAAVPTATFTGSASAGDAAHWVVPFAKDEASFLSVLTTHYYLADGKLATSNADKLLASERRVADETAQLSQLARDNHIAHGFRYAEANSFWGGGAKGVSNAYVSALWSLEFLLTIASRGGAGVNFHAFIGDSGPTYSSIVTDATGKPLEARPEFYGMKLFTIAAQGTVRQPKVTANGAAMSAYAIDERDGSTGVVLFNKSRTARIRMNVDVGRPATSATALALTGPNLEAVSGVTLGGSTIRPDGAYAPVFQPSLAVTGSTVTVDVDPDSAVLVRAR